MTKTQAVQRRQARYSAFNDAVRGFLYKKQMSYEELGAGLCLSRATLYRRMHDPGTLTVDELRLLLKRTEGAGGAGDEVKDSIIQLIWGN